MTKTSDRESTAVTEKQVDERDHYTYQCILMFRIITETLSCLYKSKYVGFHSGRVCPADPDFFQKPGLMHVNIITDLTTPFISGTNCSL